MFGFNGFGVHLEEHKLTNKKKIIALPIPKKISVPITQHIGVPNLPVVEVGALVKTGQVIAKSDAPLSAWVHAPTSGKVVEIVNVYTPQGTKSKAVVIESDGKDEWVPKEDLSKLTPIQKISKLKEFGLVGLGGATFPTHAKLTVPEGKKIQKIIINCAECEPYLTCDNRIMIEKHLEIAKAAQMLKDITGCTDIVFGIEDNKPTAISMLTRERLNVVKVKTKYPQGAEKVLIHSITKRWVPTGGYPIDIGIVVMNVHTLYSMYDIFTNSRPLVERVVTVTGEIENPGNYLVRLGTSFQDIILLCGGMKNDAKYIISGGPMMGMSQFIENIPLTKGVSGLLILKDIGENEVKPCIKCAKCVDACPMGLMPNMIAKYSEKEIFTVCNDLHAMDCFECGCCAYSCPAKIPLVQYIKNAKFHICRDKKCETLACEVVQKTKVSI